MYAMEGNLEEAIACFSDSIKYYPSAEAYTYLGWMLSFLGNVEDAIDLCQQAILLDPELGNPYNDIGSYLMSQGKLDEAVEWLNKAKNSKKYDPRHFPYINMGKICLEKGDVPGAIKEFSEALRLDPDNEELEELLDDLTLKKAA